MLINKLKSLSKSNGFTLVEIVVVAPIVVLVITGILVVLINFISSNAVTSSRLTLANDTHAALSDIGSNLSSAQSFAGSVDSGLSLQNSNSADYSSQPSLIGITTDEVGTGSDVAPAVKDCSQAISTDNLRPTATIYYVDSSGNLKRRILTQSTTPCGGTSVNARNCRAFNVTSSCINDTNLVSGVTSFVVKYCISGNCSTSNAPADADSADISIAAQEVVAGQNISTSDKIHVGLLAKAPDRGTTCPSGSTGYTDQSVTGTASGRVWGTDIYTNDSTVGKAAVHAGLVSVGQTATIRVCALPGQSSYTSSTRNGVTTLSYGSFRGSIALILAP